MDTGSFYDDDEDEDEVVASGCTFCGALNYDAPGEEEDRLCLACLCILATPGTCLPGSGRGALD
jgi:hypothetical protein